MNYSILRGRNSWLKICLGAESLTLVSNRKAGFRHIGYGTDLISRVPNDERLSSIYLHSSDDPTIPYSQISMAFNGIVINTVFLITL